MSLQVFNFDNQEIRFVGDRPVANDVAKALGYAHPSKTISTKVKEKNKGITALVTPGGRQQVMVLEEAGIYQLVFSSKLPSAEKFQDWTFEEVLPSIRKVGSYSVDQLKPPQTYLEALKALVSAEEEKEQLALANAELADKNGKLRKEVDELFGWSSIIRVAKYNQVDEKKFNWRPLKRASQSLGIEVKKAPCPRFGTKNLYDHRAWEFVYPDVDLPESEL